jgi:hypothetical protein
MLRWNTVILSTSRTEKIMSETEIKRRRLMEKTFKIKEKPTPTAFKVLFSETRGFAHDGRHHKLTVVGLQNRDGVSKATGFANSFQKYAHFVV